MPKKLNTKNVDFKETLWKAADKLRNQMDAAEYKHIVLGLIFLKYISDTFDNQREKIKIMVSNPKSDLFISQDPKIYEKELEERDYYTQDNVFWVPQNSRWEKLRAKAKQPDIGTIIDNALIDIENENKFLSNKLDKRYGRTELDEGKLGELIDEISKIGFTEKESAVDLLGEVYEYFLGQFAIAEGKKGGQFYTPSGVVRLLVEIISPFKGRVYDPCCGSGGMFVQSQAFINSHGGKIDDIAIYGQESNPTTWRLAAMNLAIRGIGADLGKTHGDTFGKDQFPDTKFDYILANPHFNDSDWGGEKYEDDVRWKFGRPPIGNANYAWLQHILWKLKTNGEAGVILSSKSMDSKSEKKIREKMIEQQVVEMIVFLPNSLFINAGVSACLWILKNNKFEKSKSNSKNILFIDARDLGTMQNKVLRVLTNKDLEKISSITKNWKNQSNYNDIDGFCRSVSSSEIKNNNYDLTPSKYVGFYQETKEDNETVESIIKELEHLNLKSLNVSQKIKSCLKYLKSNE